MHAYYVPDAILGAEHSMGKKKPPQNSNPILIAYIVKR